MSVVVTRFAGITVIDETEGAQEKTKEESEIEQLTCGKCHSVEVSEKDELCDTCINEAD